MKQFPAGIKFKYDWRSYQKRILDELDDHLKDDHLHIVAPPGSGKTILGLEVCLRLDKPTLVLAPTIAIRNQWIERLKDLFLQEKNVPKWISKNINEPAFFTVSTYQGLHAACSNEEVVETDEEEDEIESIVLRKHTNTNQLVAKLKSVGLGTIVIDEAHHLKNAWWTSLIEIKNTLKTTVVGLTATPPYDTTLQEWERYLELNGPVDGEITVPELVVEGDLCPHQDYLYFSKPVGFEALNINKYKIRLEEIFQELKEDSFLIDTLQNFSFIIEPQKHLEWIYSNIDFYSCSLIYLNSTGFKVDSNHLKIIGDKNAIIPLFNYEWAADLLNLYLYNSDISTPDIDSHREGWIKRLKRAGLIQKKKVSFDYSDKVKSQLASSISKLDSIVSIVEHEYSNLKSDLRQVILSDYIRKETMEVESDLLKIGVLPIFEKLRRTHGNAKLGVLTGSIVVIPKSSYLHFEKIANSNNISKISTSAYPLDDDFLIVNPSSELKQSIISIVTELFEKGGIEVLVGTKSLLGEGWDAPSINSLILASFVGSYVLSNQMRGRAIRSQKGNNSKTGNIWHLVCIDENDPLGGADLLLLERRFKAFVGIALEGFPSIENGLQRLGVLSHEIKSNNVDEINSRMLNHSSNRDELKENWIRALESGNSIIEEIKMPFPESEKDYSALKSLYFNSTIGYLLIELGLGTLAYLMDALSAIGKMKIRNIEHLKIAFLLALGGGFLVFGRKLIKVLRLYIQYRDISKDIQAIGQSLLESLRYEGSIKTKEKYLVVKCSVGRFGDVYCHLEGGSTFEKSIFIQALEKIVSPVINPRYLMIRKSKFGKLFNQKDYHSFPDQLGRKKKYAQFFKSKWSALVGNCEMIYTRVPEGRKILLKARMSSLSARFSPKTERVSKWR